MSRILIVDDMAIFRDPIAACLRQAGHEAECASDGAEALAAMRRSRPDVLLLDLAMPKVNGIQVLRAMRADPALINVPVILLTAVSDRSCVVEAAKLGVRDYLLKSRFSLQELLDRVNRHARRDPADATPIAPDAPASVDPTLRPAPVSTVAAAHPQPGPATPAVATVDPDFRPERLMTREESLERAEAAFDMKTMPGVVIEVIAQAASPRSDTASLAALIGRDSMLAAKVLQAANSAAYASNRGMVATLPEAVKNIGCGTVRNVAASLGIIDVMPGHAGEAFSPIRCWQHSLAVAVLCERLAALSDLCPPNVAYLVGLCHDLGEILFRTAFAGEFKRVVEAQRKTGTRRDQVERLMLGVTHNEVVNIILRKLGLPDSIRRPIEAMGSPADRAREPAARILALANVYANGLTLCESPEARVAPVTSAELKAATGTDNVAVPEGLGFRGEIVALTAILARLSSAQERELTTPLLPATGKRVWMLRDRGLARFDPIEALLAGFADVRVEARLPSPAEAAEIDRIVVVGRTTSAQGAGLDEAKCAAAIKSPDGVLWLTGREDLPVPKSTGLRPRAWPLTIGEVHAFVAAGAPATVAA